MVQIDDSVLGLHEPIVPRVVVALTADALLVALHPPAETTAVQLQAPSLLAIAKMFLVLMIVLVV
jgi:hypothetical protein